MSVSAIEENGHETRISISNPDAHEELTASLRTVLRHRMFLGHEPDEYASGNFFLTTFDDQSGFSIIVNDLIFPWIRLEHEVAEIPKALRLSVIEFTNDLSGRTSTLGASWRLGEQSLWQVGIHRAETFDPLHFWRQFQDFVSVATERSPEIRDHFSLSPQTPERTSAANTEPESATDPKGTP